MPSVVLSEPKSSGSMLRDTNRDPCGRRKEAGGDPGKVEGQTIVGFQPRHGRIVSNCCRLECIHERGEIIPILANVERLSRKGDEQLLTGQEARGVMLHFLERSDGVVRRRFCRLPVRVGNAPPHVREWMHESSPNYLRSMLRKKVPSAVGAIQCQEGWQGGVRRRVVRGLFDLRKARGNDENCGR